MPKCSKKNCKKDAGSKFKTCQQCREVNNKYQKKRRRNIIEAVAREGHRFCTVCSREFSVTESKFKTCQHCRKRQNESLKKRRRKIIEAVATEGHRFCTACSREFPLTEFKSLINRRMKRTLSCKSCRKNAKKTKENKTTKRGKCREFWFEWKKRQVCIDCGCNDYRVMEADHVYGIKVHAVSDYTWWACNGSVEAMKKELQKCEPRCTCCHSIVTKKRYDLRREVEGRQQPPSIKRRGSLINQVKMNIAECLHCKRIVTLQTCAAFDFDHRDEENKVICISLIVRKNEALFQNYFQTEIPKCDLLCRNCHHIKTFY